jgi:hypothetical protein
MTATMSQLKPKSTRRSDRRASAISAASRVPLIFATGAGHWRSDASDLQKFKAAMLARRSDIKEAINPDFSHRSRDETGWKPWATSTASITASAISVASCARLAAASPRACGSAAIA